MASYATYTSDVQVDTQSVVNNIMNSIAQSSSVSKKDAKTIQNNLNKVISNGLKGGAAAGGQAILEEIQKVATSIGKMKGGVLGDLNATIDFSSVIKTQKSKDSNLSSLLTTLQEVETRYSNISSQINVGPGGKEIRSAFFNLDGKEQDKFLETYKKIKAAQDGLITSTRKTREEFTSVWDKIVKETTNAEGKIVQRSAQDIYDSILRQRDIKAAVKQNQVSPEEMAKQLGITEPLDKKRSSYGLLKSYSEIIAVINELDRQLQEQLAIMNDTAASAKDRKAAGKEVAGLSQKILSTATRSRTTQEAIQKEFEIEFDPRKLNRWQTGDMAQVRQRFANEYVAIFNNEAAALEQQLSALAEAILEASEARLAAQHERGMANINTAREKRTNAQDNAGVGSGGGGSGNGSGSGDGQGGGGGTGEGTGTGDGSGNGSGKGTGDNTGISDANVESITAPQKDIVTKIDDKIGPKLESIDKNVEEIKNVVTRAGSQEDTNEQLKIASQGKAKEVVTQQPDAKGVKSEKVESKTVKVATKKVSTKKADETQASVVKAAEQTTQNIQQVEKEAEEAIRLTGDNIVLLITGTTSALSGIVAEGRANQRFNWVNGRPGFADPKQYDRASGTGLYTTHIVPKSINKDQEAFSVNQDNLKQLNQASEDAYKNLQRFGITLEKWIYANNTSYRKSSNPQDKAIADLDFKGLYDETKRMFGDEFKWSIEEFQQALESLVASIKRIDFTDTIRSLGGNIPTPLTTILRSMGYQGIRPTWEGSNEKGVPTVLFNTAKELGDMGAIAPVKTKNNKLIFGDIEQEAVKAKEATDAVVDSLQKVEEAATSKKSKATKSKVKEKSEEVVSAETSVKDTKEAKIVSAFTTEQAGSIVNSLEAIQRSVNAITKAFANDAQEQGNSKEADKKEETGDASKSTTLIGAMQHISESIDSLQTSLTTPRSDQSSEQQNITINPLPQLDTIVSLLQDVARVLGVDVNSNEPQAVDLGQLRTAIQNAMQDAMAGTADPTFKAVFGSTASGKAYNLNEQNNISDKIDTIITGINQEKPTFFRTDMQPHGIGDEQAQSFLKSVDPNTWLSNFGNFIFNSDQGYSNQYVTAAQEILYGNLEQLVPKQTELAEQDGKDVQELLRMFHTEIGKIVFGQLQKYQDFLTRYKDEEGVYKYWKTSDKDNSQGVQLARHLYYDTLPFQKDLTYKDYLKDDDFLTQSHLFATRFANMWFDKFLNSVQKVAPDRTFADTIQRPMKEFFEKYARELFDWTMKGPETIGGTRIDSFDHVRPLNHFYQQLQRDLQGSNSYMLKKDNIYVTTDRNKDGRVVASVRDKDTREAIIPDLRLAVEEAQTDVVNPIQRYAEQQGTTTDTLSSSVNMWKQFWQMFEQPYLRGKGIDESMLHHMYPEEIPDKQADRVPDQQPQTGIGAISSSLENIKTLLADIKGIIQTGLKIDTSAVSANPAAKVATLLEYTPIDPSVVSTEVEQFNQITAAINRVITALRNKLTEINAEPAAVARGVAVEVAEFDKLERKIGNIAYWLDTRINNQAFHVNLQITPSPEEIVERLQKIAIQIENTVTTQEGSGTFLQGILNGTDKILTKIESKINAAQAKEQNIILRWFNQLTSELSKIASQAKIFEELMTAINNPSVKDGQDAGNGLTNKIRTSLNGLRKEIQQYYTDNPIKIKVTFPLLKKDLVPLTKEVRDYFAQNPLSVKIVPIVNNNFKTSLLQQIKTLLGSGVNVTVNADARLIKETVATDKTKSKNIDPLTGQTYGKLVPFRHDNQNGYQYTKDNEFRAEQLVSGGFSLSRRNAAMGENYYDFVGVVDGQLSDVRAAILQITRNEQQIAVEAEQAAAKTAEALKAVETATVVEQTATVEATQAAQQVTVASQNQEAAASAAVEASQATIETSQQQKTNAEMVKEEVETAVAQIRAQQAEEGRIFTGRTWNTANDNTASAQINYLGLDETGRAYKGSLTHRAFQYEDKEQGTVTVHSQSTKDQVNFIQSTKEAEDLARKIQIGQEEQARLKQEYIDAGKTFDLVVDENFTTWINATEKRLQEEQRATAAEKAMNESVARATAEAQQAAADRAARIAQDAEARAAGQLSQTQQTKYTTNIKKTLDAVNKDLETAAEAQIGLEPGTAENTAVQRQKEAKAQLESMLQVQEQNVTTNETFAKSFDDVKVAVAAAKQEQKAPFEAFDEQKQIQQKMKSAYDWMYKQSNTAFMPEYKEQYNAQFARINALRTETGEWLKPAPETLNEWKQLIEQVKQFQTSLQAAGKGKYQQAKNDDIQGLHLRIQQIISSNSSMSASMHRQFDDLDNRLLNTTNLSVEELGKIRSQVLNLNGELIRTGQTGLSFFDRWRNKMRQIVSYFASFVSIYRVIGIIRQGSNYIKEFDNALTEMMKVSNETQTSLRAFQKTTFDLAASVGTTATQIQNSTADFMRLGESMEQAARSAVTANKLQAVSEFSDISAATEALTAMSQAYKELDKDAIVDVVNELGNNYAISTDGVATALQASASALRTAQNDLYESAALVTAGNQVVQDPNKVGTGIRTIALRITGTSAAKKELEDQGENVDDFVMTTTSKMDAKIRGLTQVITDSGEKMSVSILDANGNYRSTYAILLDIAKIWDKIAEEDKKTGENRQNALLELLGGKIRANIVASILESPDVLERAYFSALNSEGSANIEQDKYLDSIEGHVNLIKVRWQELWDSANNRKLINWFLELAEAVMKVTAKLGLLGSALAGQTIGGVGINAIRALSGKGLFANGFGLNNQSQAITNQNKQSFDELLAAPQGSEEQQRAFLNVSSGLNRLTASQKEYIIDQRVMTAYGVKSIDQLDEQGKKVRALTYEANGLQAATEGVNGATGDAVSRSQALGMALKGLGKSIAIGLAVTAAITAIIALQNYLKKLKERQEELAKSAKAFNGQLKEFQTTVNNNQSTLTSLDKKFEKQSKGVNALGQNVSQTDEQYQEYLDICNQVASISPDQVSGYTAEGNAIINLTNKVRGLSDAYQETIARRAQVFLNKGDDEGNTAQSIEDYYASVVNGTTGTVTDLYTQLGRMESNEEFGAYIDNLQTLRNEYIAELGSMTTPEQMEQWQASAQGQAAQQLEELAKFLKKQNIDWDPLTQDYSEVSSDVSQGQLRSTFHINEGAAKQIIDDAAGQVMTLLRTRLNANMDILSDDEYNIISSLLTQLSNQDIQTLMEFEDYSTAQIMQILVSQLSEQENVDVSDIQKAITYKTLSPKMTVSEMKEVEGQYLDILKTLFGGMMSRDELTESFGLDASEQLEKRIKQTALRFAIPRTDATIQDILSEMEELGIDTQNELGMFAESWADTWDLTKQNWDEVVQAYLDRLAESVKMDWSGNKEMLDTLQSDISDLGSMVQDLYVNPVDPEKIIDVMQTLGEKGYDVADYTNIDAALDAYYGHVRKTMMEKLDEIGASNELKEYFQTMFNDALNVNLFDQVSDLEKSLGNIQSAYDNVQAAMKEYNELGFLTMGTIDSLVALDDSYINTQIDQNGVLQYNEEAFKQVALARIDEAKAAIWEETNSELVRIAHLNEEAAAQELAKANGTLSDSAYRQARASQVQAQAAGTLQRQLADQVWEAGNKRVKLLDYQIGQLNNGTYDFGKAAAGAASSAESSYGELFDFFERRIEVLEHAQSILEKSAELLEGAPAKNSLLAQNTAIVKEEYKNYTDALGMYTTAANFYFNQLDAEMQEKILNGSVDLKAMIGESGEAVNGLLESYVQWANKAQDCREKLIELRKELAQLELAKFKNVQQDYINQFDLFQGSIDNQDAQIALAEEAGELVGQAFYEEQRREATEQLRITTEEYTALQDQLNQSLQSGLIEEGSDEWLEMVKALQEVEKQSLSTEKQIVALNKSIRQQKWDTFTRTMTEYENLGTELENLGELFNDQTDIEVSDGFLNWTEAATAQQGTLVQRYETSKQSIFAYQRAISDLNDEYAAGKWSTIEYNEKLWELKQGQWGAVESCEALEDAIMDMNEKAVDEAIERINDEIEAYQELTDAQKESLQAEKDLHDWQKKLTESNKNISDLERQLAAMQNDNTASTVAKRKKQEEELAEAKADLEEEEYQHSIDTQQDALDKQMKDYQKNREKEIEQLEESLKDRTKLIQQVFNWVLENAASIGLALEEMAKQNGINISTYITEPWTAGATALGGYSTVLTESTGAWATILEGISQAQIALQEQANGTGQAIVNESNESKDSVWGLSQQLRDSYTDANNLKEACDAISDSAFTELEEGFSAENVVSALSAIESAARAAGDAQGNIPDPKIEPEINYNPLGEAISEVIADIEKITTDWESLNASKQAAMEAQRVIDEIKARNREKAAANDQKSRANTSKAKYGASSGGGKITMSTRAKGGLITPRDSGTFDAIARAVGEDTMIAARYGESVLTPLQTDAMIKMAPFLETIASQLPDFSRAGKIAAPMVGSGMVNNAVQIGSLVTINGNVDDNNLKQIQQTVQTELRKSFSKINRDFKYT